MSDEPADPEDFSAGKLEGDGNRSRGAKTFRRQDEGACRVRSVRWKQVPGVAANHQTDKAVRIKPSERAICGDRSVLQNGDVVAEVEDLIQTVRDVEDRDAPVAQAANKLHQDGDVRRRKR